MKNIFISYSRTDTPYAMSLADDMERRGFNVWIDREGIHHGSDWFRKIEQAIAHADAVVVIMTPESEQSEWCEREIMLAQRDQKLIFPVLLRGREFGILINIQRADVRNGQLPPESFYQHVAESLNTTVRSDPFASFRRLRFGMKPGRSCLVLGLGLVAGAVCVMIGLASVLSNMYNNSGDGTNVTNLNNSVILAVNPAQNAADFAAAILSGNLAVADTYVCPQLKGSLATAVTADYVGAGVHSATTQTLCNVSGSSLVTCQMGVLFNNGLTATVNQTYQMSDGLVCGVVSTNLS
jgi:hypothetical protein